MLAAIGTWFRGWKRQCRVVAQLIDEGCAVAPGEVPVRIGSYVVGFWIKGGFVPTKWELQDARLWRS